MIGNLATLDKLRLLVIIAMFASAAMSFCFVGFAQVDIEPVARLHYAIESKPTNWFEGFASIVSGSFSPYASHRSEGMRDSAYVVRTSSEEAKIAWSTVSIPQSWKGDSVSFLWACGFGNNLGNERFDVDVNNSYVLSFSTPDNSSWSVQGEGGIRLSFVAVSRNSNGANFGYMILTLSRATVETGKPITIQVRGTKGKSEVWYRMFAYGNALRFLRRKEHRAAFSHVALQNFGDASIAICTGKKNAGSTVRVLVSGKPIAQEQFGNDGAIAKATLWVPRHLQPSRNQHMVIQISGKVVDTLQWDQINRRRLKAFLQEELTCDRYVFPPGELPAVHWGNPEMVYNQMGDFPLKVSYYDGAMQQVVRAEKSGRYAVVVEAQLPSGFRLQRFITLYCSPVEFDDYSENTPIKFNQLNDYGISKSHWQQYEQNERRFAFGSMKMLPAHDPDAAIFLAGLSELDSSSSSMNTPRSKDRQWWITFKQTLYSHKALTLQPPKKEVERFLRYPSIFTQKHLGQIRDMCKDWVNKTGVPHVTLVAHKGTIVFQEAFNKTDSGNMVTVESPMWMASITKLLTGVLMMQFVDQGLVELDAPVSKYLPELSSETNLTIRQLFTHTTGLDEWVGEWASDWNPALENQIAQALPYAMVGKKFSYNRVGYAIAAKVMERITGRAVPYLFQDNLFTPLGMRSAYADNTYGGLYCTASDLSRLGQMLLNRGTSGGYRFFTESTYQQMLPTKLARLDRQWGIGTAPMEERGLSKSAFGHLAASGSVLRIDPENDLIIISARNKVSENQEYFEKRLIEVCSAPLEQK
jgi:hypothetical protein